MNPPYLAMPLIRWLCLRARPGTDGPARPRWGRGPFVRIAGLAALLALLGMSSARAGVLDAPAYPECEFQAFVGMSLARSAMQLGASREALLAAPVMGDFQRRQVEEIMALVEAKAPRNHAAFAAKAFRDCAAQRGLVLPDDDGTVLRCVARLDIVFLLQIARRSDLPVATAVERTQNFLGQQSREIYPPELVSLLGTVVYKLAPGADDLEVRQVVFQSCYQPDEWRARRPRRP